MILLRVSSDEQRSIDELRQRCRRDREARGIDGDVDFTADWVRSPHSAALANHVVDTYGRSPDEVVAAILDLLA